MTGAADIPSVHVLVPGFIERDGSAILDASSTVTLVESKGQRLIVDTGSPRDWPKIARALRLLKVDPDSVRYVVNTHLHIDHIGCNDKFGGARLFAHTLEDPPVGTLRVSERTTLFPGVEIVPTPGHTAGSLSVFVTGEKRVVIAGDALPTRENYLNHVPPAVNVNRLLALKTMDMILAWAEIVVPGHGPQFEVLAKK